MIAVLLLSTPFVWLVVALGWLTPFFWLRWRAQRRQPTWLAANDWLAGGLLWLLTLGFFWRTLSGDVFQPADGGDLVSFLYPTYRFAAAQLQQWTLPLWNPHLYGGAPFIGDIQAGFLYLPNLLLFLLWPDFPYSVMQWLSIGHLYWAGLGMYILLRTWQWRPGHVLSRPAALFGAIAFQFSDPLLIHLGNLNLIAVLSWLPWTLAAYHRALRQQSYGWAAVAALLFALSTYAGHAQSSFYVAIAVAIYTIGYGLGEGWEEQAAKSVARSYGTTSLATVLALLPYLLFFSGVAALLAAPILLPAFELTRFTERSTFTYQDTVDFSLAPTQLIGVLTPSFFGRGPALHWSLWARVETPYAGVATLLLAIAALYGATANNRVRRRLLPWLGLALFGVATALGIYALAHGWLAALVPLFGQFRAPARALVLWTFSVAVLGAVGVEVVGLMLAKRASMQLLWQAYRQLLQRGAQILLGVVLPLLYLALLLTQANETAFLRASVAALALTLATLFWLGLWGVLVSARAGWLSRRGQALALVALLFFDLSATGAYTDISPRDPTEGFAHSEIVAFLQQDALPTRIDTLTDIADLWQPDTAALVGLQDVGGIANPLMLAHWQTFWSALGGRQTLLYDMLNVGYVIVKDGTPLPEGKFTLAFDAPGALAVYQNLTTLPRAWLVHQAETAPTPAQALARLQEPTFDPRQQAVVTTQAPLPTLLPATGAEQVAITQYGSNSIALTVNASAPALLVLSEIWYPGWRATVDEQRVPVLQVNSSLRGVPVPSGQSTVFLTFAPTSWRWGLGAFAAATLGLWLLAGRWLVRRRRAQTVK
ncbi:MAG: YfhO family protein [Caldilineaceae bacterium]|nr:YfhO family protein [Caldilineaceae bacterium]